MPLELRRIFEDTFRGDDRRTAHTPSKPAVLGRRTTYLLILLGFFTLLYVTLYPFRIDPAKTFHWNLEWIPPMSGDAMANVLAYIPLGVVLRLALRRRGSRRMLEWGLSFFALGLLSYFSEAVQTVLPARVPSWTDVFCNFAGGTIGIAAGPFLQRYVRNLHGWLYHLLRQRPFKSGAVASVICVTVHGLAPLDLHPSPGHLMNSAHALQKSLADVVDFQLYPDLTVNQVVDKVIAGGAYALPAFLLVLAGVENGRTVGRACWNGFGKILILAAMIETVQFATISKVAHPVDLLLAWTGAGAGVLMGLVCLQCKNDILRKPALVLRGIVAVAALVLAGWAVASVILQQTGQSALVLSLPMSQDFYRCWDGVLGDYVTAFLNYGLVAALLTLWYRSRNRAPRQWMILLGTLTVALLMATLHGLLRHENMDSARLFLAIVASATACRLDRAMFGTSSADKSQQAIASSAP